MSHSEYHDMILFWRAWQPFMLDIDSYLLHAHHCCGDEGSTFHAGET